MCKKAPQPKPETGTGNGRADGGSLRPFIYHYALYTYVESTPNQPRFSNLPSHRQALTDSYTMRAKASQCKRSNRKAGITAGRHLRQADMPYPGVNGRRQGGIIPALRTQTTPYNTPT